MQWHRAMLSALHVVTFAELLVAGGSVNLRRHEGSSSEQFFAYDYSKHGQDWAAGNCASRSRQSPIDLPTAAAVTGTFAYKYSPIVEPFEFMNNGHAFSAELAGLGYGGITYENAWYNLLNVNIHSLSEHSWNGVQMPVELHLVHKRYDGEALLVVAIAVESPLLTGAAMAAAAAAQAQAAAMAGRAFFQLNASGYQAPLPPPPPVAPYAAGTGYLPPPANEPMFNPTIQAFLAVESPPMNMKVQVPRNYQQPYNLNLLMGGANFYEYAGSLTAPPCAEIVTWLVRQDTVKASDKQVMYLHDMIYKTTADFGNYRSLMPLNGRTVTMRQGLLEDQLPTVGPAVPMPGKPQQSDREFRAMKWAMDAMVIAKSATDYVKDLDSRLRNAAQAHANALAPQLEPLMGPNGQVVQVGGTRPPMPGMNGMPTLMPPAPLPPSPLQMQKTAETMARTLADAARQEIEDATTEISQRSKEAAMQAAAEAANMVLTGKPGDMTTLAKSASFNKPGTPGMQPGVNSMQPGATPGMPQAGGVQGGMAGAQHGVPAGGAPQIGAR